MRAPLVVATIGSLLAFSFARDAFAYRPFDGTDADVADLGEFELEAGGSYVESQGNKPNLGVPAFVLNLGILPRVELVLDGRSTVDFARKPTTFRYEDSDLQLKYVIREGTLQGKTGLSVATEVGPLFPTIHGDEPRFGAIGNLIVSYAWSSFVFHLNDALAENRDKRRELLSSLILEFPQHGAARPVAELLFDRVFNESTRYSLLLGMIHRASDSLDLDLAARGELLDGHPGLELRLGITWSAPVWAPAHHDGED